MSLEIPDTYINDSDLCDCAECQIERDAILDALELPEDIYEFTASEFAELLDDIDFKGELAAYWQATSDINGLAATTFASALEYIAGIPPENAKAGAYVADFARSLFNFIDVEVLEDGTPVL
jgi:hypothetical protein